MESLVKKNDPDMNRNWMPFFHHRTARLDAFGVLHHIYRCRFFILDEESILALILRLENPACPGHAGALKIKQEKTKSLKEKSQRLKKIKA